MEPGIQRFEAANLRDDRLRDSGGGLFGDHLDPVEEQAEHTLLPEASSELPYGFGVGVRFLSALHGRTVFKEDQGTDEFIAPLDLIDKAQLQLRKVTGRFHEGSLSAGTSCPVWEAQLGGTLYRPKRVAHALSASTGTACSV
jgi:hypothetical protein